MTKKQANKPQQQTEKVVEPVEIIVEESKQDIIQRASKSLDKFIPHEKYILRKTKLITKKKNQAIEFIKLDKHQIAKAVKCLQQFDKNNNSTINLFTEDGFIYLQFDLGRVPQHYTIRPVQIELPHPIYSEKFNSRFTVFSCDPENTFTDKIQNLNIPQISEVIGYEKAKKNYKQNKDKLKLIAANDAFFCDWKIYNLLRQPLGKVFYDKKKYPFPIDCEDVPEDLKSKFATYEEYLNDLGNHTYFMMGNGPVYSLKIGRISMQPAQLVKNIMRSIFRTIPHILGKQLSPSDIRQITLKTFNSPCLPIYNYLDPKNVSTYKTQEQKNLIAAKKGEKKQQKRQEKKAQKRQEKKIQKKQEKKVQKIQEKKVQKKEQKKVQKKQQKIIQKSSQKSSKKTQKKVNKQK